MILYLLIDHSSARAQTHGGLEQYYYTDVKQGSVVPKLYYETKKNWYGEVHYNYEGYQTSSFNVGKVIANKGTFAYAFTPFAGIVLGKLNGYNLGSNLDIDYGHVFFSSESQFTFSFEKATDNFFFNWSEAGYHVTDFFYSGVALQITHSYQLKNVLQPGLMIGLNYKNWSFPLYAFNPGSYNGNIVLGINWEWKANESEK